MRTIPAGLAAATLAVLVTTVPRPDAVALSPTDAWITTKVKLALATEGIRASTVDVDTVARQVTLHGSVETAAHKDAAERSTRAIDGVREVRNLLQIVPAIPPPGFTASDADVRNEVSENLAKAPSLRGSSIRLHSVDEGVVTLTGRASSLSDQLTAVQLAESVRGVRRVRTEIEGPDLIAESSLWKEPSAAGGRSAVQRARSAARDLYLTSTLKMRLLANPDTPALDINVDTRAGVVTLFGIVPTAESRAGAEVEARNVAGASSVRNLLQVVAPTRQPAVKANDESVETSVKRSLAEHSDLAGIGIEVRNCVVRLTGSVPSGIERVEAMQLARATTGVCSVRDDLSLQ